MSLVRYLKARLEERSTWLLIGTVGEIEMRATSGGADQCNSGSAYATGWNSSFTPGQAFDNSISSTNKWQGPNGTLPQWIGYAFPSDVSVTEVALTGSSTTTDGPTAFQVQYHDSEQWQTLWSPTTGTWTSLQTKVFTKP